MDAILENLYENKGSYVTFGKLKNEGNEISFPSLDEIPRLATRKMEEKKKKHYYFMPAFVIFVIFSSLDRKRLSTSILDR